MPAKPVAEVTVLPVPRDSAAKGHSMTTSSVEADARALVWPPLCCCCGTPTGVDAIGIYSYSQFGNTRALIHIPYCRRCQSHYRRAGWRAFESAVSIPIIGFTILLLLLQFGMLPDIMGLVLQLLVFIGAAVWAASEVGRERLINISVAASGGTEFLGMGGTRVISPTPRAL